MLVSSWPPLATDSVLEMPPGASHAFSPFTVTAQGWGGGPVSPQLAEEETEAQEGK